MYNRDDIISNDVEWNKAEYDTIGWAKPVRSEDSYDEELLPSSPK